MLFIQIQGSARIKLEDGSVVRINYDAHNGFPYMPVGRILIERNIIPKDQMSMQKIREYMEQSPDAAKELRRQNRSYVFFREVKLAADDEAVGAQGVPLTAGRSIAVDKSLHVYGTPFFIEGNLPIESDTSNTPFRRLMIAPGHRLRDCRSGARGHLFRGGRGRWPRRGPSEESGTLCHAAAEQPRSGAARQDHAVAGRSAIGHHCKIVSAERSAQGTGQGDAQGRREGRS